MKPISTRGLKMELNEALFFEGTQDVVFGFVHGCVHGTEIYNYMHVSLSPFERQKVT